MLYHNATYVHMNIFVKNLMWVHVSNDEQESEKIDAKCKMLATPPIHSSLFVNECQN